MKMYFKSRAAQPLVCYSAMFESVGTLRYQGPNRLVVEVDQDIADYYRKLIPPWKTVFRSRWPAHITVVRAGKEIPVHTEHWGKYEGMPILFFYRPQIHEGKIYYWLEICCAILEDIREELGLSLVSQYTLPPAGFRKVFHMTIGNMKT